MWRAARRLPPLLASVLTTSGASRRSLRSRRFLISAFFVNFKVNDKRVVGLRPPLKELMPARLRLAAAARSRSSLLVPASPASAPALVLCGHAKSKPGLAGVHQSAVLALAEARRPAPGRRFGVAQQKAAVRCLPAAMNPQNPRKTVMAAACAAAMMCSQLLFNRSGKMASRA